MAFKGVRRKIDMQLVESYGLNFDQVKILMDAFPKQAKAILLHAFAKFFMAGDSTVELKWRSFAPPIIEQTFGEGVYWCGHNSVTWSLPGASYKPDWMYILESGRIIFVENKASKLQPGYRDARSKIRAAATLYPFFGWYEALPKKDAPNGWIFEEIEGDKDFAQVFIDLRNAGNISGQSVDGE